MKKTQGKITYFIELLSYEEVAALYRHFSGVTQVKFKDRADAEVRLLTVSFGKPRAIMMQAFKEVGISEPVIFQYKEMLRGPIAFPTGQMTATELKRHAKALAAGKESSPHQQGLNSLEAAVLIAIQKHVNAAAPKSEIQQLSSTELAKELLTNVNAVCRAADKLAKLKYITVEDDSNEEHKFYWLTLLPAGAELKVAPPTVKLPSTSTGPRSSFAGKYIFRLKKENPRRINTHGWKSYNLIKDGMTFDEYKTAGGRNNDLAWDIDHKNVELRDSKDETKTESKEEGTKVKPEPKKSKTTKASAGTVPDGSGGNVSKGQTGTGNRPRMATRPTTVLRKRTQVRRKR